MTTAELTLDAIETEADEAELPWCDACGEDIHGEPCDYHGDRMCSGCYDAQAAEDERDDAELAAEEAQGEVDSIEEEIADLRRRFEEELAEAKGRLADAKRAAAKARRRLAKLGA